MKYITGPTFRKKYYPFGITWGIIFQIKYKNNLQFYRSKQKAIFELQEIEIFFNLTFKVIPGRQQALCICFAVIKTNISQETIYFG